MAERCPKAYRKGNENAVRCKAIAGNMDYCIHTVNCTNTKRYEANGSIECQFRDKPNTK